MSERSRTGATSGDLATFERGFFSHEGVEFEVFRKDKGPAVIVITEMPGISPMVLGFADRVVALGCSVVLPSLFGVAGRDPLAGGKLAGTLHSLGTIARACVQREFNAFVANRSPGVITWLQALARVEHERCGGPGVGVVGMCFTGGFALAMAADERVLAPVLSQPSLPLGLGRGHRAAIDCDPATLDRVARRCSGEGLRVLGLRFDGDPLVPAERFAFLRERLGDGFISVELPQSAGHPADPLPQHHSVLTSALIDEPGEPTREALDRVLDLFHSRLLAG
jgi:dienelactone hydrolase